MVIQFKLRGLQLLFTKGSYKGIPVQFASRIERILDRLDSSMSPNDMNLPGYRFHELKGKRKGVYAVSVSGNWRISFEFKDSDVVNVNLEDYH